MPVSMTPTLMPSPVTPRFRQVSSTRVNWAVPALLIFLGTSVEIFTTSPRAASASSAFLVARRPMPGTAFPTVNSSSAFGSTARAAAMTESAAFSVAFAWAFADALASALGAPASSFCAAVWAAPRPVTWTKTFCTPLVVCRRAPVNFELSESGARSCAASIGTGTAVPGGVDPGAAAALCAPPTANVSTAKLVARVPASSFLPARCRIAMYRLCLRAHRHRAGATLMGSAVRQVARAASQRRLTAGHTHR